MKIYNTLTKGKQAFVPLREGEVSIYACGPTVYNYFHIGNARPFILFDTLRRYLRYRGYRVTLVQNFTDIDDKMINRANQEGISVKELADRFIQEYYVDAHGLNIMDADVAPKATEHIEEIIAIIRRLVERDLAYESEGDVYFAARDFEGYGKLSGQNIEDLTSGARVDIAEIKRDPLDFALWKAQKPGEPAWESPWGMGRPGWHIECSAMSMKYLGESIDIHGGGQDLVFPHHENEIAQSEGFSGKPFSNYWMHNGYINVDNQKMSKSLNNFFTVREIGEEFELTAVRLFMLGAHYRSPINFSRALIEQAENGLGRIRQAYGLLKRRAAGSGVSGTEEAILLDNLDGHRQRFIEAMDDDLNTADALGRLFELVRQANTAFADGGSPEGAQKTLDLMDEIVGVLGLLMEKPDSGIPQGILDMADQREAARKERDWAEADRLRALVTEAGYSIEDTKEGPLVKKL